MINPGLFLNASPVDDVPFPEASSSSSRVLFVASIAVEDASFAMRAIAVVATSS
jgi:hypothetical protein